MSAMMPESIQTTANLSNTDRAAAGALLSGPVQTGVFSLLAEIVEKRQLIAHFQPIISMPSGKIVGYEGLIRGPSDSPLHSPLRLFKAAGPWGLSLEVERLCRQVVLETFVRLKLAGKLFLNVSPECLLQPRFRGGETLDYMCSLGLSPHQVVIELTENQPTYDYPLLIGAVRHYRAMGLEIAIDDLGEGFSSLRLWSELRPEYVKIDQHFIQNINQDPVKLQFVRSIQQIAENSNTRIIAEGIETHAELAIIRDIGIAFGQGHYIARPGAIPAITLSADAANSLSQNGVAVYPRNGLIPQKTATAMQLLIPALAVAPETDNDEVFRLFSDNPSLQSLPVVRQGIPVGLINRGTLIDRFARPFRRELYGKASCTQFMDPAPLVVDKNISLQELSDAVVAAGQHHLSDGFIITDQGTYIGVGTGHDLMREITQMQISAARYANPLTLLPGNVPINEHINRLLESQIRFCACYCDLDNFKPFNDIYGYRKGDEIIQTTGGILSQVCDPERDFIGHIGGDDFIVLFQSPDWELRCRRTLDDFARAMAPVFKPEHHTQGGYLSVNRRDQTVFHPLITLSIGAVPVEPGWFSSHHEISTAAADAKKQAKRMPGNSLFIERRGRSAQMDTENDANCNDGGPK